MAPRMNSVILGLPGARKEEATTVDETFFRGGFEPQPNDVFIGVMGVTGAGKSTFIEFLADSKDVKIGHGLQSCTQEVTPYLYRYNDERNVYLIDTPGFDDTNVSDVDVLMEITNWLSESFEKDVKLSGMLYFHRITDPRMQGSAKKNLLMFQALCGSGQFTNVILVTTMWEDVSESVGIRRETELKETEEFWGCMVQNGSIVERHHNNPESAKRIVEMVLRNNRVELKIQTELVTQERELQDTAAAKTLEAELAEERERSRQREAKRKADYEKALQKQQATLAEALKKQKEEARREAERRDEDLERLKMSLRAADLRAQNERRKREMQEREQEELRKLNEETMKTLQMATSSAQPKRRSHPGPNRIQECRSVTLVGDAYYFCGPDKNESKLPSRVQRHLSSLGFDQVEPQSSKPGFFSRAIRPLLRLPMGDGVRAFALGSSNSFYVHHHQNGRCKEFAFLPDYPGLTALLAKHRLDDGGTSFGCPRYLSLGVNGQYFIKTKSRSAWDLPKDLLEQSWWQAGKVKAVWLGMNDAWVVELKDGATRQDLKGQYSSNENFLERKVQTGFGSKRAGHRIKAMALDLTNPESYIAIWADGTVVCNAAGGFDQFVFEEFATKNFGTQFSA